MEAGLIKESSRPITEIGDGFLLPKDAKNSYEIDIVLTKIMPP